MMMAGLDGIARGLKPSDPLDVNLYDLSPDVLADVPTVPTTLDEALDALEADHAFLTAGGVFTDDLIDTYVEFHREQSDKVKIRPHPFEFPLYFDG
jgi:glutamine synthetase